MEDDFVDKVSLKINTSQDNWGVSVMAARIQVRLLRAVRMISFWIYPKRVTNAFSTVNTWLSHVLRLR